MPICSWIMLRRVSFDTISREVAHLVRTKVRAIRQRRRWELYHGNGESWNPLLGPRDMCASLLTCQPRTHQRRPLRRDVTVWTVPLTWSESPLIIRPFAKFSLRTPFQLFLSFLVLTQCACAFDGNERWAKGEETRRRPRSLPNRKHAFNKTRFAWYTFLTRSIFFIHLFKHIAFSLSNCLIYWNTY